MLHDLFMVELYFEPHSHGHKVEDMVKHYGEHAVQAALWGGMIEMRDVKCNKVAQEQLCYLSRAARKLMQDKHTDQMAAV